MPNRRQWVILVAMATSLTATRDATGSPKCPNLSGNYMIQGEDGQVHISIDQRRCDRITIVRKSGYLGKITFEKHTLNLDGIDQKDSPWLGGSEQFRTSARFVGSKLEVKARTSSGSTLTLIYSLTSSSDLLEGELVAKRQK